MKILLQKDTKLTWDITSWWNNGKLVEKTKKTKENFEWRVRNFIKKYVFTATCKFRNSFGICSTDHKKI